MEETHTLSWQSQAKTSTSPCGRTALFTAMLAGLLGLASSAPARALDAHDFAVQISARVQSNPAQIRLQWSESPQATGCFVSRRTVADATWNRIAALSGNASGYVDTSVVIGAPYEYEVVQTHPDGVAAYGYLYAGIELPFPADRGRVVLVVENTHAAALAHGLARLEADLTGDGWSVLRRDVSRAASPPQVKDVIRAEYNADPVRTRAVLLFGHVPVPYSGNLNPDMHPGHLGAWPADGYYGDMEGGWTDQFVTSTNGEDSRNHNRPGDGKFDQSEFPGRVTLQVGRVDLSDLESFGGAARERELLQQYLDKNHTYRHRSFTVRQRALIRDNFGEIQGDAPAADAWRSFSAMVGSENIRSVGPGQFFSVMENESYIVAYGGGGGGHTHADGVGSTGDFAARRPQCVFFMLHGSYFGDWDFPDNFLRAALASSGYGLAAAWTGLPHWFLHHMGLGETIGFSTLLAQNNRGLYKNHVNLSAGQVHVALMGDPTLRMHMVAPPSSFSAVPAPNGAVALSWAPSSDPVRGYYVYRAPSQSGPFSRLTRSFVTGNSYTDAAPPAGPKVYMVRAVVLATSSSGSYYNPSQGIFATVQSGAPVPELPVVQVEAAQPVARELGPVEGAFVVTRTGPAVSPLRVSFAVGGTARNGADYEAISDSITMPQGASSAWISIMPIPDSEIEGAETVTLSLAPSTAYRIGNAASATVTIEETPQILQIARQPEGGVRIQFSGSSGRRYVVLASEDFRTWSPVANGVFSSPIQEFVDSAAVEGHCRFYRFEWLDTPQ